MKRLAIAILLVAARGPADDRNPSPSGELFAQYTLCSVENPCIPQVVITKRDGTELKRFVAPTHDGPCASILDLQWGSGNMIGVTCHANPSLSYYGEVDITSGKLLREYLGYGFVRSPDYEKVAHVGWIIHFAPPWVQSEYLQVGNTILYPLPPGTKPVEQKVLDLAPNVVKERGLVFAGVHGFASPFVWSPDSRRIGFIDCLVDYRLRDDSPEAFEEHGQQENRRCFATAVGLDGKFNRKVVPPIQDREFVLQWSDARTLVVNRGASAIAVHAR